MTPQSLYLELEKHLLQDTKPSVYLNAVSADPTFQLHPFPMLGRLKRTEQSPLHHPEGNVWNHTMLVVDEAAAVKEQSKNPTVFLWAALLHDIGKPATTRRRKGKITAHDHDKVGAELSKEFLQEFTDSQSFIQDVSELIRYHMQILFVIKGLPFADIKGMAKNTDVNEVALLGLCDRLGRANRDREHEYANIELFLQKCNAAVQSSRE